MMTDAQKVELIDKIIGEVWEQRACADTETGFYEGVMLCIEAVVNFGGDAK